MRTIGISCFYHDAAAAFVEDGKILFALHEERLTRIKHDSSFPINTILYGLNFLKWDINSVDNIIFYENPDLKFKRILTQIEKDWPKTKNIFENFLPFYYANKYPIENIIRTKLNYHNNIFFSEHHLSHAASSYYISPFKEALIVTIDGVGEFETLAVFEAKGNQIQKKETIHFPNSLGLFYSVFTDYLGFEVNEGEYKVMGLAPYGNPIYTDKILDNIIKLNNDGTFELNLKYFDFNNPNRHYTDKLINFLNINPRKPSEVITEEHKNLAASVQKVLEITQENLFSSLLKKYHYKNICLGGGVALNCTANANLIRKFNVNIFIQPAAGDAGGALGAALLVDIKNFTDFHRYSFSPYLGTCLSLENYKPYLDKNNIKYEKINNLSNFIADELKNGKVFGIIQGRDEFGPRALGNRSIIADTRSPEMKNHLNAKIKFREEFRPFAPVVLQEYFFDFYENLNMNESPYMLFTHKVLKPELTPATTHVDNTSRIQTLKKEQNPFIYEIIQNFFSLTNVPVIINTSFNLKGEPIVSNHIDAIKTFFNSNIDYLIIENLLIRR